VSDPRRVLVVEDDDALRRGVVLALRDRDLNVDPVATGDAAVARIGDPAVEPYDLVLTDLRLPGADGIAVLRAARARDDRTSVVVITAYGSVESAVEAMRTGAFDFVEKPLDLEQLELRIARALDHRALLGEVSALRAERAARRASDEIVGESRALRAATDLARRVAATRSTVLVTGETGTGKELVAGLIHRASPRRSGPLVKVNCAALPEPLLESELFGHERGAFTGADRRRVGRFEEASGGTLFLDEVGDLSAATQVKLLRVLQDQEFHRLGGSRMLRTDARIVAATHSDLAAAVRAGRFREDLFFRLDVIRIHLPPLRERPEDLVPLAHYFLHRLGDASCGSATGFSRRAIDRLRSHAWPGNIRELRNVIERAALLARGPRIGIEDVVLSHRPAQSGSAPSDARCGVAGGTLATAERQLVLEALQACGFVQKEAAGQLGISRRKLNYMIRRLGITHPSWRRNRPSEGGSWGA